MSDLREPSRRHPRECEIPDPRIRDPRRPDRILVVGTGAQVLDRIREVDAQASITLMCRVEMLREVPAATTANEVIAIGDAAPPAEWSGSPPGHTPPDGSRGSGRSASSTRTAPR